MTIKKFSPNDIKKNEVIRINNNDGTIEKMIFLPNIQFGVNGAGGKKIDMLNNIHTETPILIGVVGGAVIVNPTTMLGPVSVPDNSNALIIGPVSIGKDIALEIGSGSTLKIM